MARWLWAFFLAISTGFLFGQSAVEISDAVDHRDFMPTDLLYFVDTTNSIPFAKISSTEFENQFQKHSSYHNSDFKENKSYWIKLVLKPPVSSEKFWLLEFYDQTIDSLVAYVPQPTGQFKRVPLGDHQRFSSRIFLHKNFELPLQFEGRNVTSYFFKVRSHEFADIRLALRSTSYFVYYALNEYYLYGMFYGMILIITLYNFMVYLAIREIKFIYYICYILSVALYAMSYDGIGFQYLWPSHPTFNDWAIGVSLYSVILWSLIFTKRFLSARATAPRLNRLLSIVIIARTIWFVVSLTVFPRLLTYRVLEIIPLSIIFFTAISVWSNGYRPARFFVIAYGVLFTGFFLRTLVYFNVIPFTIVTHYSLHFSFAFEMLFLTVALGDRIRILKDNRDRALKRIISQQRTNMALQDKVNRELEEKVKERTIEVDLKNSQLEESNQKLVKQSNEINQINSLLDLDNWKLKNRVKEVLEERMHETMMDYKEFSTLYPDDLACYRFIDSLKMQRQFECPKCSNSKHSPGAQKFSRRCTRCGYNESITSNTLFHGIKFPIAKAFYLTYLSSSGKHLMTLDSLSEKLSLRLNTIWAFRQKVSERLASQKQGKAAWEDLILDSKRSKVKGKKIAGSRENIVSEE
ncbi:MAG TPA: 7TM diverse intracellular signaling domain-containing protein [Cyclobacteriaceae bacterium]|nr:7TM diverse intracellular signaling domain-containing protein [Cyclobacteriaceae bacterium]